MREREQIWDVLHFSVIECIKENDTGFYQHSVKLQKGTINYHMTTVLECYLNGVASVPVPGLNILLLEYRY